jgi:hypothetical protein
VNEAPTALSFTDAKTSLAENISTTSRIKVANIVVTDDALGAEALSLAGADSSKFEIVGSELFLRAGVILDFEAKASYAVTINVNDPAVGGSIDISRPFALSVTNVNEAPTAVSFTEPRRHLPRALPPRRASKSRTSWSPMMPWGAKG